MQLKLAKNCNGIFYFYPCYDSSEEELAAWQNELTKLDTKVI